MVFFFFNDTATTEIYTRSIVGSVRCVQETGINAEYMGEEMIEENNIEKMVNTPPREHVKAGIAKTKFLTSQVRAQKRLPSFSALVSIRITHKCLCVPDVALQ
eukprot:TRINITY_DN24191_c0_g1_i5.p2 TRINITY_DN24191_c0_g1~~TRINITY_DN24191_c0_g1_i5.p2  ORF type:complete len:103 (-),score=22.51 TRINITY_DN24191_c0_g1_i5:440-748(-)